MFVFKIGFFCVQNITFVMLTDILQFKFYCLLRIFIISNVHGASSVPLMCCGNIITKRFLLRNSKESFDIRIVKMLRKVQCWAEKNFDIKKFIENNCS